MRKQAFIAEQLPTNQLFNMLAKRIWDELIVKHTEFIAWLLLAVTWALVLVRATN